MKYLIHELCFRIVRVLQLSTTMIMFQDLDKGYYRMNMTMFLDCEDCGGEYEGDCPIHGPLVIIKDTKVRCWTGLFGLTLTRLNTRATVRGSEMTMKCQFQWWRKLVEVEVEWGFYALSASKAIFRARTYNCNLLSPVMMIT